MRDGEDSQRERFRANVEALSGLLRLADQLRRTNAAKWGATPGGWQAAVRDVLAAPAPAPDDPPAVADAVRAARSAGLRLGDSGSARLASVGVGRPPDSSLAGQRFLDDLAGAGQRLAELRGLCRAEPRAAPDRGLDSESE